MITVVIALASLSHSKTDDRNQLINIKFEAVKITRAQNLRSYTESVKTRESHGDLNERNIFPRNHIPHLTRIMKLIFFPFLCFFSTQANVSNSSSVILRSTPCSAIRSICCPDRYSSGRLPKISICISPIVVVSRWKSWSATATSSLLASRHARWTRHVEEASHIVWEGETHQQWTGQNRTGKIVWFDMSISINWIALFFVISGERDDLKSLNLRVCTSSNSWIILQIKRKSTKQ